MALMDNAVIDRLTADPQRTAWRHSEAEFITRLREAIERSNAMVNMFRRRRTEAIQAFVGHLYGNSTSPRRPASMLEMAVTTLTGILVGQNPRHWVTKKSGEITPFCEDFELALNKLDEMINFEETLQSVVTSSLFGPGIIRSGLGPSDTSAQPGGYLHDPGQFYADEISLNDYVVDPNARRREEAMFEGNYYDLPVEYVLDSGLFENTDYIEMEGTTRQGAQHEARNLSHKQQDNKLVKTITLIDLWIPPNNPWASNGSVILTLEASKQRNDPLRIIKWDGPEEGPYDMLGYRKVPDNLFDLPPMYVLLVMDDMINAMSRRQARRAERDKIIVAYARRAQEDADRVKAAIDGDMVGVDNPDAMKEFHLGGMDPEAAVYIEGLKMDFSKRAGNLEQAGGYGSDANTATEFLGVQENADVRMDAMRGCVHRFVKSIKQKEAYYLLTDPVNEMQLVAETPDADIQVPITFGPNHREGEFHDYNIDVHPYSMQRETPQRELQNLLAWFERVVMPTLEISMMQGAMFNAPAFVKQAAKYFHLKGMDQLYLTAESNGDEASGRGQIRLQRPGQGATPVAGQKPKVSVNVRGGGSRKPRPKQPKSATPRLGGSSSATGRRRGTSDG